MRGELGVDKLGAWAALQDRLSVQSFGSVLGNHRKSTRYKRRRRMETVSTRTVYRNRIC